MFGSKLKSWMENYIGRSKKKEPQKEKPKGNERIILESSESLAQSDTGISSSSQQVLSSSTTDNREGYSTTTMESERSGMTQTHTAVSLPSPESAYSTGYSTDGASPGATGPPEYYINIRTGKHYFPSPAPTPTSPQPENDILQLHTKTQISLPVTRIERELSSSSSASSCAKYQTKLSNGYPGIIREGPPDVKSPNKKTKSQLTSLKLFLKSPKTELPIPENKKLNGKTKKWFKQPFQKFGYRRTDERVGGLDPKTQNFCYFLTQENSASPRQRNRIKTNPWLPTEPLSSQNFHNLSFSPMLTRNRSCSNTPLQNRKTEPENRVRVEKVVSRHPVVELSDHSEEDLTLNEMMGTYNESYVYDKETDILSDSDPTDCEDYGTDSEANNGGDERDSHDDELDFIDNGSIIESEDSFPRNTGKCTYYDTHIKKNSFLFKSDRHHSRRGSECRKDSKGRREKRRQVRRSFRREDERKTTEQKIEIDENVGGLNLSRVLVQRMMAKKVSKSAEGTPVIGRREKRELRESHIGNTKPEERRILVNFDDETDIKYKQLMKEAENMYESIRNSPACKIKNLTKPEIVKKNPRELGLKLPVSPKKPKRLEFEKSTKSAHSPLDPLGPSLRHFAIFKPKPTAEERSSSEESEKWTSPIAVPIAFQSLDLGKPITSYCPQSEPVKRKIYTCSKTYDRIVKQFESKPDEKNGNQGPPINDRRVAPKGDRFYSFITPTQSPIKREDFSRLKL